MTMQPVERHEFPASGHQQGPQAGDRLLAAGARLPFLRAATVPAGRGIVFFSGLTPPVIDAEAPSDGIAAFGDTYTQTIGVFRELETSLAALGLDFSDLVKVTVYMVGDPALGGRMDSEGFSAAYATFFGTAAQPHLICRTRAQIIGLVNPGWLVEIEAVAAARP